MLKGDDDRYPAGGEATKGAGRVSELTGRALKLAGRAPDPDGRVRGQMRGPQSLGVN